MQEKFIVKNERIDHLCGHESPVCGNLDESKIHNTFEELVDTVSDYYGKVIINYSEFYDGCIQIETNCFTDRMNGIAGVVEYVHVTDEDKRCCHMLHRIYVA